MKSHPEDESTASTPLLDSHKDTLDCDDRSDPPQNLSNIDVILDQIEIGLFHYLITLSSGFCYGTGAVFFNVISFLIVTACDLDITRENRGWLSLSVVCGLIVGSLTLGKLGDTIGRRRVLILSSTLILFSNLASAFAVNYNMIVILGPLSGISLGGIFSNSHIYLIEFFPRSYRGISVAAMTAFVIFGGIYSCLIAMATLSHPFYIPIGSIYFSHWRLYILVASLPTLISLLSLFCLPDSIRYILKAKQPIQALQVIDRINRINSFYFIIKRNRHSEPKKIEKYLANWVANNESDLNCSPSKKNETFIGHILRFKESPFCGRLILLTIAWFGFGLAFHGLRQWLPVIIAYYINGNSCKLGYSRANLNETMSNLNQTLSNSISCLQGSKLINTISDILFGSCLAAPVAILCTIFINRTGRKLLFITVATLTGLSIFLIWLIDKTITAQIFATIFTTIAVNGWIPLELWSAELFPTELRASAVGFVNFISGLGFLLGILTFSLIFHVSCTATLLLPAILCTFGGLLSCLLPDTTGADID